jgi:hypothetical protein
MHTPVDHQSLRDHEKLRRKALWTLSNFLPGDPNAMAAIRVLDDIGQHEKIDEVATSELRSLITTNPHSAGLETVREDSIPEPWRERFLQASVGSTRTMNGPYLHDFEKFIALWHQESQHLEAHRAAAVSR